MHCKLGRQGRTEVVSTNDDALIRAGYELTRMEGIIPAIESAHAIAALSKKQFKQDDVVVLTVSGRGDKDVETYLKNKNLAGEYGNF
jgi:tryptophan synthase beta chain